MGDSKKNILIQFFKFNFIGIINTVVSYALYAVLVMLGINYILALVADYIAGAIFSFVLNKKYTFKIQKETDKAMLKRALHWVVAIFLINLSLLYALVELSNLDELIAQLIVLVVITAASFLLQKLHVFARQDA